MAYRTCKSSTRPRQSVSMQFKFHAEKMMLDRCSASFVPDNLDTGKAHWIKSIQLFSEAFEFSKPLISKRVAEWQVNVNIARTPFLIVWHSQRECQLKWMSIYLFIPHPCK